MLALACALPLQSIAAATMLYCGQRAVHGAVDPANPSDRILPARQASSVSVATRGAPCPLHSAGADAAGADAAVAAAAVADTAGADTAGAGMARLDSGHSGADEAQAVAAEPGCSVCAVCCAPAAFMTSPSLTFGAAASPAASLAAHLPRLDFLTAAPERPPRALA
ncbi:MAG: hypothetical protein AB7G13_00760 [Lautropia sp.]